MPRPQVSGCEPVSGLYILRGGPDMSGPYSVAAKASGSMRASTSTRRGGFYIRPERLRWPQGPAAARGLAALHMTREGLLACAALGTPPPTTTVLSAVHGLVQGLADGTGTGDLGLEVRLDLVGQDGLGQVAAEDGRIGQDAVQLVGDGLGLAELDAGELGLQLVLQRVSTDLKGVAVVVDGQQITQPTGDGQRNADQAVQVAALGDVALDGLAKADADLLGRVGSDALRHVGHEGVGQALLDDLVDEGLRVKDLRVNDDGQALDVAQALDEGDDVLVLHLGTDQVIAQHAAVHAHGGVQRVQAGGDLHALGLVDGLAVGHVDTGLLQRGAAVGELVLDDQILRALGVDERGNEGVLGGDDGGHALLDDLVGARGDLVDHGPGEGDLGLIGQVVDEVLTDEALLQPCLGNGHNAGLQLLAVVGAVVHADDGQRIGAVLETLQQQGGDHAHGVAGVGGALVDVSLHDGHQAAVGTVQSVALLGDGEGDHLQAGIGEDLLEAGHHLRVGRVGAQALGHRADDLAAGGAVRVQGDVHRQVVIRGVDLVDDVVVEGVGCDDAAVGGTLVQQALLQRGDEAAEDVARTEVDPDGVLLGGGSHGSVVKGGQLDAQLFPLGFLVDDGRRIHLHNDLLLLLLWGWAAHDRPRCL